MIAPAAAAAAAALDAAALKEPLLSFLPTDFNRRCALNISSAVARGGGDGMDLLIVGG